MVWREQFKPLSVELWLRELGRLAVWCENAPADADERAVRRAFHLAMLAPLGIREISMPAIPLSELDILLSDCAIEEAARATIGSNALIDLEHLAEAGCWIATFSIAGDGLIRSEAATAATAMISAWATFFRAATD